MKSIIQQFFQVSVDSLLIFINFYSNLSKKVSLSLWSLINNSVLTLAFQVCVVAVSPLPSTSGPLSYIYVEYTFID